MTKRVPSKVKACAPRKRFARAEGVGKEGSIVKKGLPSQGGSEKKVGGVRENASSCSVASRVCERRR